MKLKKIASMMLAIVLLFSAMALTSCSNKGKYTVGICQLMVHDALDQATQGFTDALNAKMEEAGCTVNIDPQVAGEAGLWMYLSLAIFIIGQLVGQCDGLCVFAVHEKSP